jgi:hypothetical protein
MSRARHKEHEKHHKAHGGRVDMKVSGNPDVFEEAAEKHKKGGRVKKKHEMHAEGEKAKHRMDRPRRARGGKVHGSDQAPFSSAKNSTKTHEEAGQDGPD